MGSSRRRLLNPSTPSKVANSTASRLRQGPRRLELPGHPIGPAFAVPCRNRLSRILWMRCRPGSRFRRNRREGCRRKGARGCPIADGRLDGLPPCHALQAQLLHQAGHRTPCHIDPLPLQLPPDLADPVDLKVFIPDPLDVPTQFHVVACPRRGAGRIGPAGDI
jgi:hypothetical protein